MRRWPLATLVSGEAGNALISLLPLVVRESDNRDLFLLGHLDVNNAHAAAIAAGAPISFQFKGPDAYASPDLYSDLQLPGWLYISVKGDGKIDSILSNDKLRELLCESTNVFGEADQKFSLDPADERIDQFIGGIRGFAIKVERVSGIAKLAQDKSSAHARLASEYLLSQSNESAADLVDLLLEETATG